MSVGGWPPSILLSGKSIVTLETSNTHSNTTYMYSHSTHTKLHPSRDLYPQKHQLPFRPIPRLLPRPPIPGIFTPFLSLPNRNIINSILNTRSSSSRKLIDHTSLNINPCDRARNSLQNAHNPILSSIIFSTNTTICHSKININQSSSRIPEVSSHSDVSV